MTDLSHMFCIYERHRCKLPSFAERERTPVLGCLQSTTSADEDSKYETVTSGAPASMYEEVISPGGMTSPDNQYGWLEIAVPAPPTTPAGRPKYGLQLTMSPSQVNSILHKPSSSSAASAAGPGPVIAGSSGEPRVCSVTTTTLVDNALYDVPVYSNSQ